MKTRACALGMFLVMLAGCASEPVVRKAEMPVGRITREQVSEHFRGGPEQRPVEAPFIEMIRKAQAGAEVLVFLGTWCSDCQREVPRFLHIADAAGIDSGRYTLYALDRKKTSPEGLEKGYRIERVPTFIFLRNGREIGRIVETPRTTLEGDILSILAASIL